VGLGIVESGGLGRDKGKWASTTLLLIPGKIRYEEVIPREDPTSFAQSVTGGIARGNRLRSQSLSIFHNWDLEEK